MGWPPIPLFLSVPVPQDRRGRVVLWQAGKQQKEGKIAVKGGPWHSQPE